MTHTLEEENERLRNRIESTYEELRDVEEDIARYDIMEMNESIQRNTNRVLSNPTFMNNVTYNDILKTWGTNK